MRWSVVSAKWSEVNEYNVLNNQGNVAIPNTQHQYYLINTKSFSQKTKSFCLLN